MEKIKVQNPALIKSLYNKYYLKEEPLQNKFVSSHWESYSEKFDVQIDKKADYIYISSLSGHGFGNLTTKDPFRKLLDYLCNLSYLMRMPQRTKLMRLMFPARRVCKSMGVYFSFDCFKQVCALELIMRNMENKIKDKRLNFLIIGDGYGFLSSLVKSVIPNSTIVLVDIGKTLLFQAIYCQKAHPNCSHFGDDGKYAPESVDFLYCPTEDIEKLNFTFDVAINIASMQEMNAFTVERYFQFMRQNCNKDNFFYCCNRELKIMPGGEVSEFRKYPWKPEDRHLVDEYCPWYKYFLAYRKTKYGPRLLGIRIPLINYFNGPVMHRLTVLYTEETFKKTD